MEISKRNIFGAISLVGLAGVFSAKKVAAQGYVPPAGGNSGVSSLSVNAPLSINGSTGALNLSLTPAANSFLSVSPGGFFPNPASAWGTPLRSASTYGTSSPFSSASFGIDTFNALSSTSCFSVPFYIATATMPSVSLLYNANAYSNVASGTWARSGNNSTIEAAILSSSSNTFPSSASTYVTTSSSSYTLPTLFNRTYNPQSLPFKFYCSPSFLPASGADGHMAVLQPNGLVIEIYATIVLSTGQVVCELYNQSLYGGLLDGFQQGRTASMIPNYAGLIFDSEIQSKINHCLAITLPTTYMAYSVVSPALTFDYNTTYSGSFPMGTRFAIPPSVNLGTTSFNCQEGFNVAQACQEYGCIVVDTGGTSFRGVGNVPATGSDANMRTYNTNFAYDLVNIGHLLQQVTAI